MSPDAAAAVSRALAREGTKAKLPRKPVYIITLMPDGEPPSVKMCETAERMASIVAARDGTDTYVEITFGHLLHITKKPLHGPRLILFGDGTAMTVESIPRFIANIDLLKDEYDIQDDFFIGSPDLCVISRHAPGDKPRDNRHGHDDDTSDAAMA